VPQELLLDPSDEDETGGTVPMLGIVALSCAKWMQSPFRSIRPNSWSSYAENIDWEWDCVAPADMANSINDLGSHRSSWWNEPSSEPRRDPELLPSDADGDDSRL